MQLFHHFNPSSEGLCFKFKPIESHDYSLQSQRIDIWQVPLDYLFYNAHSILNESETSRATRYYFERHRRRFTVARATLRLILTQYLKEQAPHQLIFTENEYGKPSLRDYPQLTFNISHSKDLALIAIGKDYPMGIDLEFFSGRSYEGIGKQLFSDQENKDFKHITPSAKSLSFFHIWAQKEAFIKACGMGLSYPTQEFSVLPLPVSDVHISDTRHHVTWKMTSFMPQIACSAAVCYHPTIQEIRYTTLIPYNTPQDYNALQDAL